MTEIKITSSRQVGRSLQDDDAITDTVGSRLRYCLEGGGGYSEGWHEVEGEDFHHQRDKMLIPLKVAIRLLKELSDAPSNPERAGDILNRAIEALEFLSKSEKARPLRVQGGKLLSELREHWYQAGRDELPAAEPPGFSAFAAELRDHLPNPLALTGARFSTIAAQLRNRLQKIEVLTENLPTERKV